MSPQQQPGSLCDQLPVSGDSRRDPALLLCCRVWCLLCHHPLRLWQHPGRQWNLHLPASNHSGQITVFYCREFFEIFSRAAPTLSLRARTSAASDWTLLSLSWTVRQTTLLPTWGGDVPQTSSPSSGHPLSPLSTVYPPNLTLGLATL